MGIKPDTALAAANDNANLRVYYQDSEGWIHEARFTPGSDWSDGEKIVQADLGSPIAVAFQGLSKIRLYYLIGDTLNEYAYDGKDWYQGSLSQFKFVVNPTTNLAARYVDGEPRVFAQVADSSIYEYKHANQTWARGQDFDAGLYSTSIAATPTGKLSLFFQSTEGTIIEWDNDGTKWQKGEYQFQNALAEGPITALSFDEEQHVYNLNAEYSIVQSVNKPDDQTVESELQTANTKSKLASLGFVSSSDSKNSVRVYFQDEEGGETITELGYYGSQWHRRVILPVK
ncbi:fucose-specific lectin [Camillea tinctor]|nr:fucose-specific lectin [Camillea tinctor]